MRDLHRPRALADGEQDDGPIRRAVVPRDTGVGA